jgi:hypothetical protein
MKRLLKISLLTLVVLFILIQFYPRPRKNIQQSVNPNDISVSHRISPAIQGILKSSCYDCHSNNTTYPWYAEMQPVAWWLGNHIRDGKKQLNFSDFGTYNLSGKYKKFDEIIKEVKGGGMPLKSYTLIHRNAKLAPSEKAQLLNWASAEYEGMRALYPADSLIGKK